MSKSSVDKRYAVPLYHQILLLMRDEIWAGIHPLGAKMPTEEELARSHGVSRITARRALAELAGLGLVERRRRIGTRVTYSCLPGPIDGNIDQSVESLPRSARHVGVEVMKITDGPATETVAGHLAIGISDPVTRIVFRKSDGRGPFGEVVCYLAKAKRVPLDRHSLMTMPMLTILGRAGYRVGKSTERIFAGSADAMLAASLNIDIHAPILRVERTCLDDNDQPLLFTTANYRGDRYRISVDVHTILPIPQV